MLKTNPKKRLSAGDLLTII